MSCKMSDASVRAPTSSFFKSVSLSVDYFKGNKKWIFKNARYIPSHYVAFLTHPVNKDYEFQSAEVPDPAVPIMATRGQFQKIQTS